MDYVQLQMMQFSDKGFSEEKYGYSFGLEAMLRLLLAMLGYDHFKAICQVE